MGGQEKFVRGAVLFILFMSPSSAFLSLFSCLIISLLESSLVMLFLIFVYRWPTSLFPSQFVVTWISIRIKEHKLITRSCTGARRKIYVLINEQSEVSVSDGLARKKDPKRIITIQLNTRNSRRSFLTQHH